MNFGRRREEIQGFEDYLLFEDGTLYHQRFLIHPWGIVQKIMPRIDRGGYPAVRLSRNGQTFTKRLHRLLAEHFIPNPENLPEVDHRDGNKRNFALTNLRWCTHADNVQSAYDGGLNSAAKKIIDIQTGEIFPSIRKAASAIAMNYNTCCKRLERNNPDFRLRYLG